MAAVKTILEPLEPGTRVWIVRVKAEYFTPLCETCGGTHNCTVLNANGSKTIRRCTFCPHTEARLVHAAVEVELYGYKAFVTTYSSSIHYMLEGGREERIPEQVYLTLDAAEQAIRELKNDTDLSSASQRRLRG